MRILGSVLARFIFPLQFIWGLPTILFALLWSGGMATLAVVISKFSAPAAHQVALVWIWVIRHLLMPLLLMRVRIDQHGFILPANRRVIVLAPHPSWSGLMPLFYAVWYTLPRPGPVVMKQELLAWSGGRGMQAAGVGWSIDRANRRNALGTVRERSKQLDQGSVIVFPEGHRPTRSRLASSRSKLGLMGKGELASCFQHTMHPRTGAVLELLRHWPDAAVVRLDNCSGVHEENILGAISMVGRTYHLRFVNVAREELLDPTLPEAEQESQLTERLTQMWAHEVNRWVAACRGEPWQSSAPLADPVRCEDHESRTA